MTLRRNTFESGVNGATIATTGAAGIDTNWGLVNKPNGGTAVYSSTNPMHGTLCALLTPGINAGAGQPCELRWNDWTAGVASMVTSWYQRWDAIDADLHEFFRIASGSGTRVLSAVVSAASKISLQNAAATIIWTSTGTLSAATYYRFEAYAKPGADTSTGEAEFAYYLGDSATPVQAMARTTSQNMGTAAITGFYVGKTASTGNTQTPFRIDSVQANDGATALIGPYVAPTNAAPTATIATQAAPQAPGTVSVGATGQDSDGQVTAIAFEFDTAANNPNLPTITVATTNLNTASASATGTFNGVPGRYRIRSKVTDSSGAVTYSAYTSYDVYALTDADVLPYAELSGTYTRFGTATSDLAAVTDTDLTTGLQSAAAPTAEKERWQWCAFGPGDIKFRMTHDQNPTSPQLSVQFTVYKADGVTQVYQTTLPAPLVNGQEDVITLDATALAAIPNLTDRRALITETSATQ